MTKSYSCYGSSTFYISPKTAAKCELGVARRNKIGNRQVPGNPAVFKLRFHVILMATIMIIMAGSNHS